MTATTLTITEEFGEVPPPITDPRCEALLASHPELGFDETIFCRVADSLGYDKYETRVLMQDFNALTTLRQMIEPVLDNDQYEFLRRYIAAFEQMLIV